MVDGKLARASIMPRLRQQPGNRFILFLLLLMTERLPNPEHPLHLQISET